MQVQGVDGQPLADVGSDKVFNLITFFFDLTYICMQVAMQAQGVDDQPLADGSNKVYNYIKLFPSNEDI